MSTVIETVVAIEQQFSADYNKLVEAMSRGETPKPHIVRETLTACGKSLDDLSADAQRLVDRREEAAMRDEAEAMADEIAEAERIHRQALAAKEKLLAEFNENNAFASINVQNAFAMLEALRKKQQSLRVSARRGLEQTADDSTKRQLSDLNRWRTILLHILEVNEYREPVLVESEIESARKKYRDCQDKNAEAEAAAVQSRIARLKVELERARKKESFCAEYKMELSQVESEIAAKMKP